MKDYLGNECQVGDTVIFNEPYYKGLVDGKIIRFTPKGIRVAYQLHNRPEEYYKRDTFVVEGQFVRVEVSND